MVREMSGAIRNDIRIADERADGYLTKKAKLLEEEHKRDMETWIRDIENRGLVCHLTGDIASAVGAANSLSP